MSQNNLSDKDNINNLFDDVGTEESNYDSKPLVQSIEHAMTGNADINIDYDKPVQQALDELKDFVMEDYDDTEDFLNELSDFLDEEEQETNYLEGLDDGDYNLPSLDDLEDEPLPSLDELDDEEQYVEDDYDKYAVDDEETAALRTETANIALGLMNYVEYNVVTLENELTILGEAFNQLLDKTHDLDEKISRLSEKITKARLDGTRQALDFIHSEIKLISDNLEGAITSTDPTDREVLQENIAILTENRNVIEAQIKGLKEIGASTDKLEKDLEVLESSIRKLKMAIDSNQVFSVSSLINSEINQVIVQTKDARKVEDEQDISLLEENLDLLMDNKNDIEERIWDISERGIDIDGLRDQLEVLNINLQQFSIAIDESIHRLNMGGSRR